MSIMASYSPLNISETVGDRGLVPTKGPPIRDGLWGIKWTDDGHVIPKGQTRDPNMYLECNISKTAGDAI